MTECIVYRMKNHCSELLSRYMHCFHSNSGKHVCYPTKEKKSKAKSCRQKSQLSEPDVHFPLWGWWVQDKEPPIFLEGTAKIMHRHTCLWERKEIPDPQLKLCRPGPSLRKDKLVSLEVVQQNRAHVKRFMFLLTNKMFLGQVK